MNVRKFIFKVLDRKKYKNINENIAVLRENINNPQKINNQRLNKFLIYSVNNSDYYKDLNNSNINEYPVLTKEILKKNFDRIITVDQNNLKNYQVITTSGSTGTPFQFAVTEEKQNSKQAQVLYFGSFSYFDIGVRHAFVRSVNPSFKRRVIKNQYIITPDKMEKEWINQSIKLIEKYQVKVIVGYPTAINIISTVINKENLRLSKVEGIITSGENLTDDMRKNIKQAFGVTPYSRYATEELGVLAHEYGDGTSFIVNQLDFLIEVVDENLNPVKEGEAGSIIVTDFKSHIIPLIRYDTGDVAKVKKYKDGLVHELEHIEGRKIDTIYDVNGKPISAFSINTVMRTYSDVLQFQFIQHTQNDYELKILPLDVHDYEDYSNALTAISKLLGEKATVEMNIVKEIPMLKSGKRPYILNNYINNRN